MFEIFHWKNRTEWGVRKVMWHNVNESIQKFFFYGSEKQVGTVHEAFLSTGYLWERLLREKLKM